MSDEGGKMCPLCTEEMDLTDQQLKPCKCGYEICVWCWHHIMEMAEKDETQGRCPACRTPYNKEKIVGMTSKCERLVTEMNVEKKLKSQKGKIKTSEGRKQFDSVRVIQRNLVYVVGLPFHLADEDILQRREYFGQYGKVLKVSISRTTTGAIQHFPNNTCSIYITYLKEEEAIRCIQLVHGFVLDGRRLRACFGTTKYCHAWLRNMPCNNPDCLYLHDIGSQDDSFTKDEIISAYTRDRVQQITGATCSSQRRSGSVLPSPTDDNSDIVSPSPGKSTGKTNAQFAQQSLNASRVSPPDSTPGRSATLPTAASWGTRSSSYQTSQTNTRAGAAQAQKPYLHDARTSFSDAAIIASQNSSCSGNQVVSGGRTTSDDANAIESSESTKTGFETDGRARVASNSASSVPVSHFSSIIQPTNPPTTVPSTSSDSILSPISHPESLNASIDERDGSIENVCSGMSSMKIHMHQKPENGRLEPIGKSVTDRPSEKSLNTSKLHTPGILPDFHLGVHSQPSQAALHQKVHDSLPYRIERAEGPEITVNRMPDLSQEYFVSKHSAAPLLQNGVDGSVIGNLDRRLAEKSHFTASTSNNSNRQPENIFNSQESDNAIYYELSLGKGPRSLLRRHDGEAGTCVSDMVESSIISNILTSDFDPWNESFGLPQNLSKFFGEEKKQAGVIGSRKLQNSSQSRFAFAREEDLGSQMFDFGRSGENSFEQQHFVNFSERSSFRAEELVNLNKPSVISGVEPDPFTNSYSHVNSSKLPVSRSQICAPPGFSGPSRLPPPGFPSLGTEYTFESTSGSSIPDASFSMTNQYQLPKSSSSTYVNGDVEFLDPAILTVGKGIVATGSSSFGADTRSNYPPQLGYEDPLFHSAIQRSIPPYENHRFIDTRDTVSSLADAYGISSRGLDQILSSNISAFSQFSIPQSGRGPWDGWNEARIGSNLDASELLRTQRLGFNDFYSSHEDSKLQIPSSENIYNGIYRM